MPRFTAISIRCFIGYLKAVDDHVEAIATIANDIEPANYSFNINTCEQPVAFPHLGVSHKSGKRGAAF